MKFAVVTLGSAGDLHPFLAIARALAERGHEVHLLSQAPHERAVRAEGVGFSSVVSAEVHARTMAHPRLWHPLDGFGVLWRHLAVPAIGPTIEALDALAGGPGSPPLVVLASPLALGARLASERWPDRIRLVTGYTAPMGLRSTADPMFLGGWRVPSWAPDRLRRALWAGLDHWKLEPLARPAVDTWRVRLGLAPWRGSVFGDLVHSMAGGLALYPQWFAPVSPEWRSRRVHAVGFPVFEASASPKIPAELEAFLSDPRPFIVVYPGSADKRVAEFAGGVVRAGADQGLRSVLLSRFSENGKFEGAEDVLTVADEVRLSDVLPRAAAFVHHGGIGSLAQGLAAEVPQLILASAYDQPENGARLKELGAGAWYRAGATFARSELSQLLDVYRSMGGESPPVPLRSWAGAPSAAVQKSVELLEMMSDQPLLPGIEVEDEPFTPDAVVRKGRQLTSYALFFALLPDEADGQRLHQVGQQLMAAHGVSGAVTSMDRLHATVQHVDDFAPDPTVPMAPIKAALAAGRQVMSAALDIRFTTVQTVRGGNGAFVLQGDAQSAAAFAAFRNQLAAAMRHHGLKPPPAAQLHLTLAYASRPVLPQQAISAIDWRATRFALILSHRGYTHHQIIKEWRLA